MFAPESRARTQVRVVPCLVIAATMVALNPCGLSAQPIFLGLGDLPGLQYLSDAYGVSADGRVVVGLSDSAASNSGEAFRWTIETGMVGLGSLGIPPGNTGSRAFGVSGDGATIVGTTNTPDPPSFAGPYRWTQNGGMSLLGALPGAVVGGDARAISIDGRNIVGWAWNADSRQEAFRWTAETGMIGLGDLPGAPFITSVARAVSADGTVVVGSGSGSAGQARPFRWTAATGMIDLGGLSGGVESGSASAVSRDGSIVVGGSISPAGPQAFFWSAATGMIGLGDLPGGQFSSGALDVSGDGRTVVGSSCVEQAGGPGSCITAAFVWDIDRGMRDLRSVLISDYGLDLTGWQLFTARAISDDGLTIVGGGLNPNRRPEAWLARIPEPTTAALLTLGAVWVRRLRTRVNRVR